MSRSVQTPSKAFAFPNEWLPVRLGSIGKTYGGLTGKSGEDFNTGSASYVTFMQVMGNSRLREPAKGTVNIKPGERQNHVQKDDLLFNGSSETPEEVALAAAVDFHPDSDTFLNSFCFGFRLLPDAPADSLFLAYLFRSSVGRNLVSSLAQGATRYNISKTQLLNQAIHLPPKAEQIAIREKLTDAEELINSLERLISKKQAIKQGMMQELLTGRTRLPGFYAKWPTEKIGSVLRVRHGRSQSGIEKSNGRYPILATGGEIGRTDTPIYSRPSVLIGRKGTIDRPQYRDEPFWTVDTLFYTEILPQAVPLYIFYLFQTIDWKSMNEASGVPSLSSSRIESIEITLPPVEEQKAIAQVLHDADDEIAALERRLESASNIKQGMMQELLSGRTRLPVEEVSS